MSPDGFTTTGLEDPDGSHEPSKIDRREIQVGHAEPNGTNRIHIADERGLQATGGVISRAGENRAQIRIGC
jgi:hypothetical protein